MHYILFPREVEQSLRSLQSCYHSIKCIPFNLQRHQLPAPTRISNASKGYSFVEHNGLTYVNTEVFAQEYTITKSHWIKPAVPSQQQPRHYIFQALEGQLPNCVRKSTDHL